MGRAFLAGCLLLVVLACREPFMGVFFKLAALLAKDPVALSPAAVQLYHHGYCMLLSFYSGLHSGINFSDKDNSQALLMRFQQ